MNETPLDGQAALLPSPTTTHPSGTSQTRVAPFTWDDHGGGEGLRAPGRVLLISCYELGHQPLNLASPVAFLRRAGYSPDVLDCSLDSICPDRINKAQFIGISVPMHTALRLGVEVLNRIRELNPACYVCFYGLYAILNGDYLFQRGANAVVGGEFEEPLVHLVELLQRNQSRPLEGVIQKIDPDDRRASAHLQRLSFPVPERGSLPSLDRYARLDYRDELRWVGYIETSRGCKHLCRHCPIPPVYGGRFFVIPMTVVLEDVKRQVAAGARHITFGDPDFFNGPTHSMRVARAIHQSFPDLTFDATIKVEHILAHHALLPELRELGCLFLVSAVESLNERVLGHLRKHHDVAGVTRALAATRSAGLFLRPSLMPFTPWETLDSYRELLDWIEEQDLIECVDPVQLSIRLLIPPGSHVLAIPGIRDHLGPLDEASFSYRWRHPDPRMDQLHETVSALAAQTADTNLAPIEVFAQIRAAADVAAGHPPRSAVRRNPLAIKPPRLTESWFC